MAAAAASAVVSNDFERDKCRLFSSQIPSAILYRWVCVCVCADGSACAIFGCYRWFLSHRVCRNEYVSIFTLSYFVWHLTIDFRCCRQPVVVRVYCIRSQLFIWVRSVKWSVFSVAIICNNKKNGWSPANGNDNNSYRIDARCCWARAIPILNKKKLQNMIIEPLCYKCFGIVRRFCAREPYRYTRNYLKLSFTMTISVSRAPR